MTLPGKPSLPGNPEKPSFENPGFHETNDPLRKPAQPEKPYSPPDKAALEAARSDEEFLRRMEEYYANLSVGNVQPPDVWAQMAREDQDFKDHPERRTHLNLYLDMIQRSERMRAKKIRAAGEAPAHAEKELDQTPDQGLNPLLEQAAFTNRAEFFILTGNNPGNNPVDARDEKFQQFFQKFHGRVPADYVLRPREEQLALAQALASNMGFQGDPALMRKYILRYYNKAGAVENVTALFGDNEALAFYRQQLGNGENPDFDKALLETAKRFPGSRFAKEFEKYHHAWEGENVKDYFQEPVIAGKTVEIPSSDEVKIASRAYQAHGIDLAIPEGSHEGVVTYDGFQYAAAIYVVDGQTNLFIHDVNSDTGLRGPIQPEQVRAVFTEMAVDRYFTEQFRHFSAGQEQGEVDPLKVKDSNLMGIVRSLTTGADQEEEALSLSEKTLLRNLAALFVDLSAAMPEKMKFFEQLMKNPDEVAKARQILKKDEWKKSDDLRAGTAAKNFSNFQKMLRDWKMET